MEKSTESGLGLAVVERRGEMAIAAMAAKAKAEVEAKFVIAFNRPRKLMESRSAILDACKREKFAEVARYKKPVGSKQVNGRWEQQFVEGFSIRFAEVAIQAMKNISVETSIIYEDDDKRTVHVSVTDLESNLSYGEDITISKTVERKKLKDGQEKLGERLNSYGDKVYLVAATDDEVANKVAAQRSKVIRNSGLRLIPQDFLEEAVDAIMLTLEKGGSDPKAEVKKIVDGFNKIGVPAGELEKYLGHSLDTVSKKELNDLRAVWSTISDGESSWADYVAGEQNVPRAEATPGPAAPAKAPFRREKMTAPPATPATPDPRDEKDEAAAGLAPSRPDGKPSNVIDIPATTQEVKQPDPQPAAASEPASTAAAPKPQQPIAESAPAQTAPTPEQPKTTPSSSKTSFVLPPSKLPADFLPTLDASDAAGTRNSLTQILSVEGISPEELLAWTESRNLSKKGQTLADLAISKIIGLVKQREIWRAAILEGRQ